MKKTLRHCMFILATAALFAACGDKDNANDPSDSPSGGGDNPGSSTYAFSGRKLAKAVVHYEHQYGNTWTYDLSWEGDLLSEITEYRGDWGDSRRFIVAYDGNRPIAINGYWEDSLFASVTYTYSGEHVTRVLYMEPDSDFPNRQVDSCRIWDYTYTDGKITKIVETDYNIIQYERITNHHPDFVESDAQSLLYHTWDGNNVATVRDGKNREGSFEYSDKRPAFCPPMGLFGIELNDLISGNPAGWGYVHGYNGMFGAIWSKNIVTKMTYRNVDDYYNLSWSYDGDYPTKLVWTITDEGRSSTFSVTYTYVD